jgi:predicted RNA binding protein YcfA (HicA-like mRNA interferase family)
MPRKLRELRADLRRAGFELDRQKGNHQIWRHPRFPALRVTLAGDNGDDAFPYQESQIRIALKRLQERMEDGQQ